MLKSPSDKRPATPSPSDRSVVTLHDVALRAGVSPMTVSNVINGKTTVRPDARKRVLDAIDATGYRVNLLARALAGGRTRLISVFSPQLNRPYATEVVHGASMAAEALNYDLVVMMLSEKNATDLSIMTQLSIGALLIQPTSHGTWSRVSLPEHVISVDGPGEQVFSVDNYGGATLAMRHLIELGHTRIGCITGLEGERQLPSGRLLSPPYDRDDAAERLRAYHDCMENAGLDVPHDYVQHGNYRQASGAAAARRLLDLSTPPTALFVSGDAMALGAIHVAQDRGLLVPRDLSVIGFDDLPIAAASRPGLTTIRQPLQRMGEVAVQLLVALAEGQVQTAAGRPPFPTELVQRESTARR